MTETIKNKLEINSNEINNYLSLKQEWQVLHHDHEKYEQFSLIIKLFSIALCFTSMALSFTVTLSVIFLSILWLQEGIWKTYQARLCNRIERIEQALTDDEESAQTNNKSLPAFRLYSQFNQQRQGTIGLIIEYIKSALRPTVAYPYSILIVLLIIKNGM